MEYLMIYVIFSFVVFLLTLAEEEFAGGGIFTPASVFVMWVVSFIPGFNVFGLLAMIYTYFTGGYHKKLGRR